MIKGDVGYAYVGYGVVYRYGEAKTKVDVVLAGDRRQMSQPITQFTRLGVRARCTAPTPAAVSTACTDAMPPPTPSGLR